MSICCKHWSFCENTPIIFGSEPGPGSELVVGLSPLDPPSGIKWLWRPKRWFPALCPPPKSVYSLSGAGESPFMYQPRPTGLVSPLISQATPNPKAAQGVDYPLAETLIIFPSASERSQACGRGSCLADTWVRHAELPP